MLPELTGDGVNLEKDATVWKMNLALGSSESN